MEQSQQQIWNNIASEWHEFKQIPSKNVENFLKSKKGKILDLGSGSGRNIIKLKDKISEFYLVDFSKEMLRLAEKKAEIQNIKIKTFVSDLTKIPFENNFFDSAICISAIHCIPKKQHKKAVKELYRVLKSKSEAYIGVWNIKSKRFKNSSKEKYIGWRDKGKRYYYLFDEQEIHNLFKKAGFKIKSTHNSEMMINFVVER